MNAECPIARILVAGTDHAATAARALVIEFAGHHCETAGSLEEIQTCLRENSFELVVADPSLGGSLPEIMRVLKRNSPDAIVMLLTENGKALLAVESDVLTCTTNDFLRSLGAV